MACIVSCFFILRGESVGRAASAEVSIGSLYRVQLRVSKELRFQYSHEMQNKLLGISDAFIERRGRNIWSKSSQQTQVKSTD